MVFQQMGQTKTIPLHVGTRYTHSIQRFTAREMSELPTGLHGHGPDFPNCVGVMTLCPLPTHINWGTPPLNLFPPIFYIQAKGGQKTNKFSDIFMGLSLTLIMNIQSALQCYQCTPNCGLPRVQEFFYCLITNTFFRLLGFY